MIADISPAGALHRLASRAVDMARSRGEAVLVSTTSPAAPADPLDLFARATDRDRFFWRPSGGPVLAALGSVWSVTSPELREVGAAWNRLLEGAAIEGDGPRGSGPLLLGTVAFDPASPAGCLWRDFPLNTFVLPRVLYTETDEGLVRTVNALVAPGEDVESVARRLAPAAPEAGHSRTSLDPLCSAPDDGDAPFEALVTEAVETIRGGALKKIVAARSVTLAGRADPAVTLRRLSEAQPHCTTFAVAAGEICFLCSTPEWLVRLEDGAVRVSCLAGSAPRGPSPEEDAAIGARLLADPKNRQEHALVLETIVECLAGLPGLQAAPSPSLMRLPTVQHLFTPVTARNDGEDVLALGARLHPTPAVSGYPRDRALRFLRNREGLNRGAYAGPVGWIDRHGEGELAVAIRSALLRPDGVTLFAGCGIMADSQPRSELEESRLKLRPMLRALRSGDGL